MRFWKFLCSSATEVECFRRNLFGLSEKYREQALKVRRVIGSSITWTGTSRSYRSRLRTTGAGKML